jgi:hypothetical protein
MSDSTDTPKKPPLSAVLLDLRGVIGLLFVVYGIVLTIVGIIGESQEDLAKAGGIALNLWVGIFMLAGGIIFYVWAFTKPPSAPDPEEADHYQEGGPLHMGHEYAETHPDAPHGHRRRGHGH